MMKTIKTICVSFTCCIIPQSKVTFRYISLKKNDSESNQILYILWKMSY